MRVTILVNFGGSRKGAQAASLIRRPGLVAAGFEHINLIPTSLPPMPKMAALQMRLRLNRIPSRIGAPEFLRIRSLGADWAQDEDPPERIVVFNPRPFKICS